MKFNEFEYEFIFFPLYYNINRFHNKMVQCAFKEDIVEIKLFIKSQTSKDIVFYN